jgi:hydrogenase maturation factor HypF (carbamoyltransferase family)
MEAEGDPGCVASLLRAVRESPPPNAVVKGIETQEIAPRGDYSFVIRPSTVSGTRTAEVLPDLATCDDCLRELFDPLPLSLYQLHPLRTSLQHYRGRPLRPRTHFDAPFSDMQKLP